jgi:hypothetical protein
MATTAMLLKVEQLRLHLALAQQSLVSCFLPVLHI